ncbi:glycosyltransferase [Pseudokineococcus basanitobsidens]|uniref:Glycosyltransferase n=1 Tax=Pseudokineococcus basanitobsidens TaxID=1926649 RepID=A0ABU8RLW2_9ACTN
MSAAAPSVSVVVPTYNESANVVELVRRLQRAVPGAEVLFVDDSDDDTPDVVRRAAAWSTLDVRLVHRARGERHGGLGGAVVEGLRHARAPWVVVMDGDLQHPPEDVPRLVAAAAAPGTDVVVASRYCGGGAAAGLSGVVRHWVSTASTRLARALFPHRLRRCSDPMTGFFALRRAAVDVEALRPRGFKILLEILARTRLQVVEVPFVFADRHAGRSKAGVRQGMHFVQQLLDLRLGRTWRFALVGATGAVANLALMAGLLAVGSHYLLASVLATEATIVGNFVLQERYVFRDLRHGAARLRRRAWECVGFNNVEQLLRLPVLLLLVEVMEVASVPAQALTLAAAFAGRFAFVSKVVYRRRGVVPAPTVADAVAAVVAELPMPRTSPPGGSPTAPVLPAALPLDETEQGVERA